MLGAVGKASLFYIRSDDLANQKAIQENQAAIQQNQGALPQILKNQEKILALLQK